MSSRMHRVEAVEDRELLLEAKVALGSEQALDERVRRGEQDAMAALDQLVPDRADEVGLAAAGQAEREDIVAALDERRLRTAPAASSHLRRQPRSGERRQRLSRVVAPSP